MAEVKEKAKSFYYKANPKSDSLVFLFHGFSGSLYDLKEVAEYLVAQHLDVKGVRLAGHGSSPEDLAATTAGDWWHSVNREMLAIKDNYKNIFIIGYSFGGNLAIDFALRYPLIIKSIVLLGPSVFIRRDKLYRFLLPYKKVFSKYQTKRIGSPKDILEYEEKGGYSRIFIKSIKEFFDFITDYTIKEIPFLKTPTLIIHSKKDKVVHPRSSTYIYNKIQSPKKELMFLDDHEHNPFFYDKKPEIFEKIKNFLKENS
ncbi:alpha/beta fold hydrolase [Candidatus Falkowbacteria bacterium]|nr:alpha/beta fold hydrolase [Candidatus Falkowbacteria bacterium]